MGFDKIAEAVTALNEAGLRAQRGYPAGKMPAITGPVAAVNVESITPAQTKLAVRVFSATDGLNCEDAAQTAVQALSGIGASCAVAGCCWDTRAGVFFCLVEALWHERAACTVTVDSKDLPYALDVTAKKQISRVQVTDPETEAVTEECRDLGWSITIRELLPPEYLPETEEKGEFTLYIFRAGGRERYEKCQWVQILLENVPGGIQRTRVARTWNGRSLFAE